MGGMGGMGGMPGMSSMRRQAPGKDPPIEYNLLCTLEQLYTGALRKMKLQRKLHDDSGRSITVTEVLEIDVKPGWKKGTKVTFEEKGNEGEGSGLWGVFGWLVPLLLPAVRQAPKSSQASSSFAA